jgi:anti-sigma-K factor RskA
MSADDIDRIEPPGDPDAALAAEYVLRLLDADEEAACAAREARDPAFAALVDEWRAEFATLDDAFAPATPPVHLQRRIEERIFGREPSALARLWQSAGLWRAVAAAAVLAALWFGLPRPGPEPAGAPATLVATLAPLDSGVQFVAYADPATGVLNLAHVAGVPAAGRDFELWLIPEEGADPLSLGVLPATFPVRLTLDPADAALFGPDGTLAVSAEPAGGSPTGAPTGAVQAIGGLDAV